MTTRIGKTRGTPPQKNRHLRPLFWRLVDSKRAYPIHEFASKERSLSIKKSMFSGKHQRWDAKSGTKKLEKLYFWYFQTLPVRQFLKKHLFLTHFCFFLFLCVFSIKYDGLNGVKTQISVLWKQWFCSSICTLKSKIWWNLHEFNEVVRCKSGFLTNFTFWKIKDYRRGIDDYCHEIAQIC